MQSLYAHLFHFLAAATGPGPAVGAACKPGNGNFLGFPSWHEYLAGIATKSGDPTLPNVCVVRVDALSDIWLIVAALIEILLRVAALGAIAFIVFGAVQLITGQGDPNASKQARQTIINAVIGLVIAIAATTLVSFVAGRFT